MLYSRPLSDFFEREREIGLPMRNIVTAFVFSLFLAGSASAMGNMSGAPGGGNDPPSIPEPAALAAFGVGAVAIGYAIHRRRGK
jgi:hypothetical protein